MSNTVRFLVDHLADPSKFRESLQIDVTDEPGAGGANHRYEITAPGGFEGNDSDPARALAGRGSITILFQNGTIPENGINGVTHEALLAIVADRLRCFQAGPFACSENADALAAVEEALGALHSRTRTRMARGVEGTHER